MSDGLLPSEDDDGSAATIATLTAERDAARADASAAWTMHEILGRAIDDIGEHPLGRTGLLAEIKARRSGLTLTAEERAAISDVRESLARRELAAKSAGMESLSRRDGLAAIVIDRLLAGARTVTAAAPPPPNVHEAYYTGSVTIERVMRALFDARYADRDAEARRVKWNTMDDDIAAGWERVACAAIAAGLDPRRLKEGT